MSAERKQSTPVTCPRCGAPIVPSIADIGSALGVDDVSAQELREALIESLCARLADTP